jgi:photosystem II stability/assembly factor-like uncharacterized protein
VASLSARAWRALAFVGLAVVAVLVVGAAHLGRWPAVPLPAAPRATPARVPAAWQLGLASFGDADHGAVVMDGGPTGRDTYVTADGGRTWTARHVGLSLTTYLDRVHAIAVVPVPVNTLESSADAGRTWTRLEAPVGAPPIGLLLNRAAGGPFFLDPADGWWIDAPPLLIQEPIRLWRTGNGGRTWRTLAGAGLPEGWLYAGLAFADQSAGAVVGVPGHGPQPLVLTTRDGGSSWSPAPLPAAPVGGPGVALATADAAQLLVEHGRFVLSIDLTIPGGGEFIHWTSVSQDGGRTWALWVKEPAVTAFPYAAPFVDDAGRLLIANDQLLWTSSDDGRTWDQRPLGLPRGRHAVAVVFAGGLSLIVASAGPNLGSPPDLTLLRSDRGGSWREIGLPRRPAS